MEAQQQSSATDTGIDTTNFDNEVLAYLSVRKEELIETSEEYIMSHPEIREVLNDFLSSVLAAKPVSNIVDDICN